VEPEHNKALIEVFERVGEKYKEKIRKEYLNIKPYAKN